MSRMGVTNDTTVFDLAGMSTCVLQTADVRPKEQPKDLTSAIIAREQSTEIYHCPSAFRTDYRESVIPEGATPFNFWNSRFRNKVVEQRAYAFADSLTTTFTPPMCVTEPIPNSPMDAERVETQRVMAAAAKLFQMSGESYLQRDGDRGVAASFWGFCLASNHESKTEALRVQTNQHSSALMDRVDIDRTMNPYVQPQVYEVEKARLSAAALMARAQAYDATCVQFFRRG